MHIQGNLQVVLKAEFACVVIASFVEKLPFGRGERGCVLVGNSSSSLKLVYSADILQLLNKVKTVSEKVSDFCFL